MYKIKLIDGQFHVGYYVGQTEFVSMGVATTRSGAESLRDLKMKEYRKKAGLQPLKLWNRRYGKI